MSLSIPAFIESPELGGFISVQKATEAEVLAAAKALRDEAKLLIQQAKGLEQYASTK